MFLRIIKLTFASIILVYLTACTSVAPKYTSTPNNINKLLDAKSNTVKIGDFKSDPSNSDDVNKLSIRGGGYVSPYDKSYVNYLKEALRQELDDARLLSPDATIEIGGMLIRNELNAGGFSTADAKLEARFIVKRAGKVSYDKVKSAQYVWDSSFIGAIAVPKAQQSYPTVYQMLLTNLYTDNDFIAAIKK